MKDIFYIIAIVALAVAVFVYPASLQQGVESRMAAKVWNELESRRTIVDSVKQELDAKRRNRELMNQMEYRQEIETAVNAGLADVRGSITTQKNELETSLNEHEDDLNRKATLLAEHLAMAEKVNKEYAGRIAELESLSAENRAHAETLREDGVFLRKRLETVEKALIATENQVQALRKAAQQKAVQPKPVD